MAHFELKIELDNDAFDDPGAELSRILKVVSKNVENLAESGNLYDINGNKVGGYEFIK